MPEAPVNVHSTFVNNVSAVIAWDDAPRADYYRVWKRVIGLDDEPVNVGSPADANFTLENLPANSPAEIFVSAVNDGGESERSAVLTITTH